MNGLWLQWWVVAVKVVVDLLVRRQRALPQRNSNLGRSSHSSCTLYISNSPLFVSCFPSLFGWRTWVRYSKGEILVFTRRENQGKI